MEKNDIKKVMRHEKKYTLTWYEFQVLNHKLEYLLKRDPYCPKDGYEVKSLYFDNPYDFGVRQKIDGEEVRHKYRLRVYNNDFSKLKLEKKSKLNVMTQKESLFLQLEEAKKLTNEDADFLSDRDEPLLKTFEYKIKHEKYIPKVIVKYTRLAYVYPIGDLRITFDYNIKKSNSVEKFFNTDNNYMQVNDSDQVIMEVKFNHVIPSFIRSAIQSTHVMASASSKYVLARIGQ